GLPRRYFSSRISERDDDRWIARETGEERLVHGQTTNQRERLIANHERFAAPQREEIAIRAGTEEPPPPGRDMQEREAGQPHRIRRVIRQIRLLGFEARDREAKSLVVQQCVLQRAEPLADPATLGARVLADPLHD